MTNFFEIPPVARNSRELKGQKRLDTSALEQWLWDAACVIRGPVDAPKFKDYILPLVFLKRLSDVFEDEIRILAEDFGDEKGALKIAEQDPSVVHFFIPEEARWPNLVKHTTGLGQMLTDAVRAVSRRNLKLSGVIDVVDFNATTAGQRIIDDGRLHALIQSLDKPGYRLGLNDVEPDILGRAYEYLLRKFSEGQGQSAGEFYTPREVGILMGRILDPEPGQTIYDPCCGSAGLLIKANLRLLEKYGEGKNGFRKLPAKFPPVLLFGQEIRPETFAMARMNAVLHDMEAKVAVGDAMHRPAFTEADSSLRRFDLVTANPMWNQKFPISTFENDSFGRFTRGIPPSSSSSDWGWIQHMFASLKQGGKMAVVLDTGAVSRGSGNQGSKKERDIRKKFIEEDFVEAVFLLPENLFYNTTAPGIILVINQNKGHKGEILIVNGSKQFSKGRPKNFLDESHVDALSDAYLNWRVVEGLSTIIRAEDSARNDFSLSPSQYISIGAEAEIVPLSEAVVLLQEAEGEQREADGQLNKVLRQLGF